MHLSYTWIVSHDYVLLFQCYSVVQCVRCMPSSPPCHCHWGDEYCLNTSPLKCTHLQSGHFNYKWLLTWASFVVANSRFTSVGTSHFISTICSLYMQAYKSVVITIFLLLIRVCEEEVKARMGLVKCVNHNLVEPYHHLRETRWLCTLNLHTLVTTQLTSV